MSMVARALASMLLVGAALLGASCEDDEAPDTLDAPGALVPEAADEDGDQAVVIDLGNLSVGYNGSEDVSGEDRVEVRIGGSRSVADAGAFSFTPTFIEGTAGQRLTMEVENNSGDLHNVTVRGTDIDVNIPQGESVEVNVTIPASGGTLFFCKFHTRAGMNGQLLPVNATPAPVEVTPTSVPLP